MTSTTSPDADWAAAGGSWNAVGRRTWIAATVRLAESDPEAPAARDERGRSLTRGDLLAAAARVAARLRQERGIVPGARVGLHLENTLENVVAVVALAGIGAVVAPVSTKLTPYEVRRQAVASRLDLVLTDGADDATVAQWALDVPVLDVQLAVDLDGPPDVDAATDFVRAARERDVDAPATIICTSGSTAAPKPIVLSHGNLMFAIVSCQEYYALGPLDVGLTFFPWCHSNGHVNQLLTWLALGVEIVVADRFTASGFPDQLLRHQPTVAFLNSTHVKMVLARLSDDEPVESRLRIVPTALDLDAGSIERFTRIFGAMLRKVYYQTELCAPVTVCDLQPPRTAYNNNPLGHVSLSHRLRLVDEHGRDVCPGVPGEILVRSIVPYGVALGRIDSGSRDLVRYDPADWWRTGDLAVADDDGFLYYAGRTSEMVKRAGHNVAIPEVVATLLEYPGVEDAAVIGAPDPIREEQIVAFVVGNVIDDDVIAFCEGRLAPYKVPSVVLSVDELPRTDIGKLDTAVLRQRWADLEGAR